MQERLSWAAHSHSERQQVKRSGLGVEARQHGIICFHSGDIINVAILRGSAYGLQEDVAIILLCSPFDEFDVCIVHRVSGLESHNAVPLIVLKIFPHLGWSLAVCLEISPLLSAVAVDNLCPCIETVQTLYPLNFRMLGVSSIRCCLELFIRFP